MGGGTGGGASTPTFSSSATAAPASVAPSATVAIGATVTDTGAALAGGVVDLEVHDAAGVLVSQQTYSSESFAANQSKTYSWSWQAPATAGVYTVEIGVFGAGSTPRYAWNAAAGVITVAAPPTVSLHYNFESSTQGFTSSGGMISGLSDSTARAFSGSRALAINFSGKAADNRVVSVSTTAATAGKLVTFHLWVPAGSQISSIQPYVQQGASGGWTWTGGWYAIGSLTPGAWNTLTVQVPANAQALSQLGLQIATKAAWTGTVWLDAISW